MLKLYFLDDKSKGPIAPPASVTIEAFVKGEWISVAKPNTEPL